MRSAKLAALAATGVLVITGCASGSPQSAAYVNNVQIPQSEVDSVASAIQARGMADAPGPTAIQALIRNQIARDAVAANPALAVQKAQRDQALAANPALATLAKEPGAEGFVNDFIDFNLIVNTEAGVAAFRQEAARTTVRLNPRYGAWDPQQLVLVEGSSGSISLPASAQQG